MQKLETIIQLLMLVIIGFTIGEAFRGEYFYILYSLAALLVIPTIIGFIIPVLIMSLGGENGKIYIRTYGAKPIMLPIMFLINFSYIVMYVFNVF